jgi:hypothetical protein
LRALFPQKPVAEEKVAWKLGEMYSAKCCVVEAVFSAAILWDCGIDTKDNIFVFIVP